MAQIWVTDKIKKELTEIAQQNDVYQEALANVGLRLLLSDEQAVKKVINLIRSAELGGEVDLRNKGW